MKKFFIKWLYPLLKMAKPYLKSWAKKELIPYLQKEVNAGAKNIDKHIDEIIKKVILKSINKI